MANEKKIRVSLKEYAVSVNLSSFRKCFVNLSALRKGGCHLFNILGQRIANYCSVVFSFAVFSPQNNDKTLSEHTRKLFVNLRILFVVFSHVFCSLFDLPFCRPLSFRYFGCKKSLIFVLSSFSFVISKSH